MVDSTRSNYLTAISYSKALKLITAKASELFKATPLVVAIDECVNRVLATDVNATMSLLLIIQPWMAMLFYIPI